MTKLKEFVKLLEVPNEQIFKYLQKNYFKKGDYITDGDNYFYQDNASPILLVAHMDTVTRKKCKVVVNRNVLTNKHPDPLGGDDRAGIFGIIEVLRECEEAKLAKPSILITNYEESGGRGVKAFITSDELQIEHINLMVELDRKGATEYVTYADIDKKVEQYVESFGFKSGWGSYSDIADLTDAYFIPSVNLSIGYYEQHSSREYQHFDELLLTVDRVIDMIVDPLTELYPVVPRFRSYGNGYKYGGYDDYDYYGYSKFNNVTTADYMEEDEDDGDGTRQPERDWQEDDLDLLEILFWDFIDEEMTDGHSRQCLMCGETWCDCTCGHILHGLVHQFTEDELEVIKSMILFDTDPVYQQLLDFEGIGKELKQIAN